MRNKLIIASFALLLGFAGWAQEPSSKADVVVAENYFNTPSLDITNEIQIYPNPAVENLIIEIKNSTLDNVTIEIHSIIGNEIVVEIEEIGNDKYRIPIKDFATGYYFVVVKDEVARFKKAYRFLKK